MRYDQAYDVVNRITRIDSSVDEASVYNYDKTGQLLDARQTFENDETYRYDANGNRTSGGTQSSGAHKNLVTQDAKHTYLYDGENNRIRRTERATGNYQLYTWDHRNRLTKVEFVNTSGVTVRAIEYRYDASDMKVAEFVDTTAPFDMANASAKWFIHDGANVVMDFARADVSQQPGAAISKRYFQGPGVDQLLAQENIAGNLSQSVWWVLPDHLGSTRDLVTASGSVVAHFQFDSFGNLLDGRENVTRYQFTGREHDSNTDYNYHRARWYDPGTGKWLSEDPISFAAGDSNIARYVGNGVLNGVDPSGLTVYAIGGTWEHMNDKANTYRVYESAVQGGEGAFYWNGTGSAGWGRGKLINGVTGGTNGFIVDGVVNQICKDVNADSSTSVNLVGWSRGAVAAIAVAKRLDKGCPAEPLPPGPDVARLGPDVVFCPEPVIVNWLGLFDPVGQHFRTGRNKDWVPEATDNIRRASIAWSPKGTLKLPHFLVEFALGTKRSDIDVFNFDGTPATHEDVGGKESIWKNNALDWMISQGQAAGVKLASFSRDPMPMPPKKKPGWYTPPPAPSWPGY